MTIGRKQFLKTMILPGLAVAVHPKVAFDFYTKQKRNEKNVLAKPTFPQIEWQESEFGIIFHFDISIATRNIQGDNQTREVFNPKEYDPVKLDTDQWVRTAKEAGATYAVFTATHFGGFLQWQSDLYPYGLKQAKWKNGKGDIVADFVKSCYKFNIKPVLYLSTHRNAYWDVDSHYVNWGKGKGTAKQKEYNHICEKMTEELCSRYGRLLQIWFDAEVKTPAEGGPNVLPIFEKYQPNGIFYSSSQRADIRWVGNEQGYADYPCWATMPTGSPVSHTAPSWKKYLGSGIPDGTEWSPAMVDTPLRGTNGVHSWFWKQGEEKGVYTVAQLNKIYEQSVGRNSNMVLGVVIDPNGLIPDTDVRRLTAFGQSLRQQYSHPIGSAKGEGKHFTIDVKEPKPLRKYVIQEDIRFGECVRAYAIKGLSDNGEWIKLDEGSCIGHKRMGSIKNTHTFSKIKLEITRSTYKPHIRDFTLF